MYRNDCFRPFPYIDPVVAGGAEWIHLVDFDAAFGRGSNGELLASMIEKLEVKVELSGGSARHQPAMGEAAAAGWNLEGAIIGKALYIGRFGMPEALSALRSVVDAAAVEPGVLGGEQ